MARLNHGCSSAFNVVYSWREDEGLLVVYALKKILKNEVTLYLPSMATSNAVLQEVLTAYTNTKRVRGDRRCVYMYMLKFHCFTI